MATSKRTPTAPASIHQLKVTLKRFRPPIWRWIQVPSNVTLAKLHDIVQASMGWYDCHLHEFHADGISYGDRSQLEEFDDVLNERTARLNQIAPPKGSKLSYQYDFGDDWQHDILVEAVLPPESGVRYPICLTGRRACPPEDCGGPWGYLDLLTILADPTHPDYPEHIEWVGEDFDPEEFDIEEANARLAAFFGQA